MSLAALATDARSLWFGCYPILYFIQSIYETTSTATNNIVFLQPSGTQASKASKQTAKAGCALPFKCKSVPPRCCFGISNQQTSPSSSSPPHTDRPTDRHHYRHCCGMLLFCPVRLRCAIPRNLGCHHRILVRTHARSSAANAWKTQCDGFRGLIKRCECRIKACIILNHDFLK